MDGIAQELPEPIAGISGIERARPAELPARADRDAAFAAIVDRNARFLYKVAFNLLRNPEDAEDAVQDTFLKLYRGDAWLAMADEKAFLAKSVWRTGLDRLSTAGAKAMKNAEDVTEMEVSTNANTPEDDAIAGGQRRLMKSLIEGLPEELRQPLVLSAVEEMKGHEVAEILGIPEATVRTRIMRAKIELRKRFQATQEVRR